MLLQVVIYQEPWQAYSLSGIVCHRVQLKQNRKNIFAHYFSFRGLDNWESCSCISPKYDG